MNNGHGITYKHRDYYATLSIWEAARVMRELGTHRFNYRLRDAVTDGTFARANGVWGDFYSDIEGALSEWEGDDVAAVDTEERLY